MTRDDTTTTTTYDARWTNCPGPPSPSFFFCFSFLRSSKHSLRKNATHPPAPPRAPPSRRDLRFFVRFRFVRRSFPNSHAPPRSAPLRPPRPSPPAVLYIYRTHREKKSHRWHLAEPTRLGRTLRREAHHRGGARSAQGRHRRGPLRTHPHVLGVGGGGYDGGGGGGADATTEPGRICLQILHAGRYAHHPLAVSSSSTKSPISPFPARGLSSSGVRSTIRDYANCAALARGAGYDGVEIMGSEGYLINQFLVGSTNVRTDEYGGNFANRMRLAVDIVRETRAACGRDFIIIFRLSMLDLVGDGSSWDEIKLLAQALEDAGVTIINTGIGWHEARIREFFCLPLSSSDRLCRSFFPPSLFLLFLLQTSAYLSNRWSLLPYSRNRVPPPSPFSFPPHRIISAITRKNRPTDRPRRHIYIATIATSVPRGAFSFATKKLRDEKIVSVPLCATNRINAPSTVESILSGGCADLVSMARPFLADPDIVRKSREGRDGEINTCIGCNQGECKGESGGILCKTLFFFIARGVWYPCGG